jgi:hypothetical protein
VQRIEIRDKDAPDDDAADGNGLIHIRDFFLQDDDDGEARNMEGW